MGRTFLLSLLALSASTGVNAVIGYDGCDSVMTTHPAGYEYVLYYLPDTGEICENADCGGGRAPPKYSKPWCGAYTGTASYSPSFIDKIPSATGVSSTTTAAEETTTKETGSTGSTSATETATSSAEASSTEASSGVESPAPTTAPTTMTSVTSSVPTGTGGVSMPPTNGTVTTQAPIPSHTGGAASVGVAGGMMAGFLAVAGALVM